MSANVRISNLPNTTAAAIVDTDIIPIVIGIAAGVGVTSKVTIAELRLELGTTAPAGGRTVTSAATYLLNNAVFNVKDFGAVGDGAIDDTNAINLAITAAKVAGGVVYFPHGTYKTTTNIVVSLTGATPNGIILRGEQRMSVIKPTIAVTIALTLATEANSDGTTNHLTVEDLTVEGVNTTNATGILVGSNAGNLSGNVQMFNTRVYRFTGASGIGLYVKDVVDGFFENVYLGRSGINCYIKGSDPALPTTIAFVKCSFREATTKGVKIDVGYRIGFYSSIFEANGEEGFYAVSTGAGVNILNVMIEDSWFEVNYSAGNYHVKADGSAGGTVMVSLRNVNFAGAAKAINFKSVKNFVLDQVYPQNAAAQVLIDTGCRGSIMNWPENNAPFWTVVTINSITTVDFIGPGWNGNVGLDANKNLIPQTTRAWNLGSDALRFGQLFGKTLATWYSQPAWGATPAIDASAGQFFQLNASTNPGATIQNPTNPAHGMILIFQIRNTSGGALTLTAWAAKYKLQSAWVDPATGFNRTIAFWYDVGNDKYYELYRTTADTAN